MNRFNVSIFGLDVLLLSLLDEVSFLNLFSFPFSLLDNRWIFKKWFKNKIKGSWVYLIPNESGWRSIEINFTHMTLTRGTTNMATYIILWLFFSELQTVGSVVPEWSVTCLALKFIIKAKKLVIANSAIILAYFLVLSLMKRSYKPVLPCERSLHASSPWNPIFMRWHRMPIKFDDFGFNLLIDAFLSQLLELSGYLKI